MRWEFVIDNTSQGYDDQSVRRLKVEGGWLYQVRAYANMLREGPSTIVIGDEHTFGWHQPVFVPDGSIR